MSDSENPRELIKVGNIQMSKKVGKLFAAIAKAQQNMKHPTKNRTVRIKTKVGGEFGYKYADLVDVIDCTKVLAKEGVCILQGASYFNNFASVTTVLGIDDGEDGQWVGSTLGAPSDAGIKEIGSTVTYLRRYAESPMAGIASEEDDDGTIANPDFDPNKQKPNQISQPSQQAEQKAIVPNPAKAGEVISEAQGKRLFAISKKAGWNLTDVKLLLDMKYGIEHTKDIRRGDYETICNIIEYQSPAQAVQKQSMTTYAPLPDDSSMPMEFDIPFNS